MPEPSRECVMFGAFLPRFLHTLSDVGICGSHTCTSTSKLQQQQKNKQTRTQRDTLKCTLPEQSTNNAHEIHAHQNQNGNLAHQRTLTSSHQFRIRLHLDAATTERTRQSTESAVPGFGPHARTSVLHLFCAIAHAISCLLHKIRI